MQLQFASLHFAKVKYIIDQLEEMGATDMNVGRVGPIFLVPNWTDVLLLQSSSIKPKRN